MTYIKNEPIYFQHLQYLPLICCSSEDTVYSMDDGVLNLLSFELVMYVL